MALCVAIFDVERIGWSHVCLHSFVSRKVGKRKELLEVNRRYAATGAVGLASSGDDVCLLLSPIMKPVLVLHSLALRLLTLSRTTRFALRYRTLLANKTKSSLLSIPR